LELLSGQRAGLPDTSGEYPSDSLNGQIQARLTEMLHTRQQLGSEVGREDQRLP